MTAQLYDLLDKVRFEFAPDARTTVFEVDIGRDEAGLVLYGAISVPAAAEALQKRVAALEIELPIRYSIVRIPEQGTDRLPHGIITAAVAPVLAGPLISESHLSQIVLGNQVLVLREHGRWLQCRSSDGYIGWIHRGYLRRVDEKEAISWEIGADAPVHVSLGSEVIDDAGDTVVRLPWGARFGCRGKTSYLPDGRVGILRGEATPLSEMPERFPRNGAALVQTARLWSGAPYLWGGTTRAGVDCSGLVQVTYRTHGVELPRDSDQQAEVGIPLPVDDPPDLNPGDLLFFAERQNRISHVAISMGGSRIIHSALGNGGVRENDLAGEGGYERELRSLFAAARSVIEAEG